MGLFGLIMALPSMIAFYAIWIASSMFRPMTFVTVFCLITNPKAAKVKFGLFVTTIKFLLLCKDKKYKRPAEDPQTFFQGDDPNIERKTVIFLRHGESTWNDTFNKGDRKLFKYLLYFIPNLIYAVCTEWYFWISGKAYESWFFDSPLSEKGIQQATAVQTFLRNTDPAFSTPKEAKLIRILKGDEGEEPSQLMSSNLRRAIATICIALQDRLELRKKNDNIFILQQLQEVSFNPDALSITPGDAAPVVDSFMDSDTTKRIYARQCDTTLNNGNKTLTSTGLERMQSFCDLVFSPNVSSKNVVAAGHSFWFRAFFQTYMPYSVDHVSKKKKLINGGIVGFTLLKKKTATGNKYMIDPKSVVILFGGF